MKELKEFRSDAQQLLDVLATMADDNGVVICDIEDIVNKIGFDLVKLAKLAAYLNFTGKLEVKFKDDAESVIFIILDKTA